MSQQFTSITPFIPGGDDVQITARFYIDHLGFERGWDDGTEPPQNLELHRDGVSLVLYRTSQKQLSEWSTFRVQTTDIRELYDQLSISAPTAIHPNGVIGTRPWGSIEFSVLDPTGVCITFYQFPA